MRPFLPATLFALLSVPALWPAALGAAPQEPAGLPTVSLERIREALKKSPPPRLKPEGRLQLPPTFRSRVDQRTWVPTLEQHLHKVFDLSPMQRQSAEWAAQCCGLRIGQFLQLAEDALRARKIRKTREQIARELAELDAAARAGASRR